MFNISIWIFDFGPEKLPELWGPFLESPGNFSGPKSIIQIEI